MKTYKYYVHGKPKTFDLTSLTPEELEKFKAMNNTERLRFIELHHLENIPLWEQIDLKTSTKLSDEGETDRKNKQKYAELFRAKNIKNQLEQMKKEGTEPTEENIKKAFNDFETQDITQAKKNGYTDIDSLINFYANKIETLNVDSIDTLKAKEIKNLEAANIKLNDTKSLAKAIEKVFPKEYVKKIVEGIEKGEIPESVGASVIGDDILGTINGLITNGNTELADNIKNYFDKLVKDIETKIGSTLTKEELNEILKTDDLKQALIDELKKTKEEIRTDIEESAEYIKTSIEDYKKKVNKLLQLQKQGVDYKKMLNSMAEMLIEICSFYGWDYRTRSRYEGFEKYNKTDKIIDYPYNSKNETNLNKALIMLCNYNLLPSGKDGPIFERARLYRNILGNLYSILLTYNEFKKFDDENEIKVDENEVKEGEGIDNLNTVIEGGKFLNRFKDFEPDIKRLEEVNNKQEDKINTLINEVKEVKEMVKKLKVINEDIKTESKTEETKPSLLNSEESRKYNFLNDISKAKNLKPIETKIYEPEEEYKDLKDILRRRREDIEPDETEDIESSEDWGEGVKHSKVIKFKELLKLL